MAARDRRSVRLTTPATVAQAHAHLRKAEEFLTAATTALAAGARSAAGGNAVLAGINAADCVAAMLTGSRWNGPHDGAAAYVRSAGEDGKAVAPHLAKLLRKKTEVHYEARRLSDAEARMLVQAATRAVAVAQRVVGTSAVGD